MKLEHLEKDATYHIYNRGINSTRIFKNSENKRYFLSLFQKYLGDKVTVFAYCLMDTHYHFLIKVTEDEKVTTQSFSNLLNAYAKAFNKQQKRTGSLFEKHFKRKRITDETYFTNLFCYIHNNPFSTKETYPFSSYIHYLEQTQPEDFILDKTAALNIFDSVENMRIVTRSKVGDSDAELGNLQGSLRENLAGLGQNGENLAGLEQNEENLAVLNQNEEDNNDIIPLEKRSHTTFTMKHATMKDLFVSYIHTLQDTITTRLEAIDGQATFQEDLWKRPEGGGGRTRVIENGNVFEKGGVNISQVHGKLPETMQQYFGVKDANFFACGLSLVLHPKSPMVPTVHANWRYFEMYNQDDEIVDQWFGGGQDLTPYYLFDEDAIHFHTVCKNACDAHDPTFYPKYKARCDEYFYNAHRNEGRGLGGLFFDYLKKTEERSMQDWYNFVTTVGDSFLEAYVPIVERRKETAFAKAQKDWQEVRRGRYVEFNLVHDKGTLFGLKTNGRIESILMSLPPVVQWKYDHHPEEDSEEARLLKVLKNPKEWV